MEEPAIVRDHGAEIQILRACAVEADCIHSLPVSLGAIWHELATGECRVHDHFHSRSRHYLILKRTQFGARPPGFSRRNRDILESVLLGNSQKSAALELGLSGSTIATVVKQCLWRMGLPLGGSRVPAALVLAAHAAKHQESLVSARQAPFAHVSGQYRLISVERPDHRLAQVLPPAVSEVVRLRIEGNSYAAIAAVRKSSQRTVANQLGMAFKRLRISGRSELLVHLTRCTRSTPTH
jgi:DNA-binding CsgD family transcriptional regulator